MHPCNVVYLGSYLPGLEPNMPCVTVLNNSARHRTRIQGGGKKLHETMPARLAIALWKEVASSCGLGTWGTPAGLHAHNNIKKLAAAGKM